MDNTARKLLLWGPRLMGILVSLFLGLFALDVFDGSLPPAQALLAFAIHLVPSLALLVVVGLSWRWEWVGGVAFTLLAAAYGIMAWQHFFWVLSISGPLLAVGLLFLWSWRHHAELRAAG